MIVMLVELLEHDSGENDDDDEYDDDSGDNDDSNSDRNYINSCITHI